MSERIDYVLVDITDVNWPSLPFYRSKLSKEGYATWQDAKKRELQIVKWCAARGIGGPDFRIVQRRRKCRKNSSPQ